MKALVTGGAGFIGHHLVNLLFEKGYEVEVWDNLSTGKLDRLLKAIPVRKSVEFKKLDLTYDLLPEVEGVDVVFHLAATTSVQESLENPQKYEQHCYMTTKRMLDWCLNNRVKGFVFASTAAVYGEPVEVPVVESIELNPMSPYAEWKLKSEHLIAAYQNNFGMNCTALRLFNVYGEGQPSSGSYAPAVALFLKQFEAFEPITVTGDGLQTRDYIYVKDVARAFVTAAEKPSPTFRVMNVGTGEELTILEIAEAFGGEIKHISARKEPRRSCANTNKIKKELGWSSSETVLSFINKIK